MGQKGVGHMWDWYGWDTKTWDDGVDGEKWDRRNEGLGPDAYRDASGVGSLWQ
ncbi:MAG: hypothetical protein Q7R39_15430 [Dehalococcoidia bacterium]|nr:hypothetical protein [Dehalococcoidia bacterium]